MPYALAAFIFYILYKLHSIRRGNPLYRLKSKRESQPLTQRSRIIEWLSRPSGITEYLTKASTKEHLLFLGYPLSSFLRAKQCILTFMIIYFWIFIWFGDLTLKHVGLLLLLYALLLSLPGLWVQTRYQRKIKILQEEVPSFMDLLSLVLQSGLNLEQALAYLTKDKSSLITQKVSQELKLLALGKTLEEVLRNLQLNIPLEDWHHFMGSILQAKQLGVSLASTLETQSEILRTKRRQKAEELSRTASVKITLPLVLFIFPALLIIYLGPGLIHLMQN